jgi:hypothetical protein
MALDALRAEPGAAPDEAVRLLEKVLADFDAGRARLTGGQPPRDGD